MSGLESQWQLIPRLQAAGNVQMALDVWLLEQHRQGRCPSILRFYTWSPAAVSLGYHQRHWPPAWQKLHWQGQPVELVRRPTGGRAVLHQGDLSYAVITSGLAGNRLQAYQKICEFLIQGWRSLGVELDYGQHGRGYIHNPNCFGTATGADLVVNQCKLIGSAQLWRGGALLQHGSIRLEPDPDLLLQVFGPEAAVGTLPPLPWQGEALIQQVMQALVGAASRCFNAQLVVQPLSTSQWQAALASPSAISKAGGD